MKKIKKKKSKQVEQKPKWRGWMTLASVFGGVALVSGATVLGVFLTGGFEEKVVKPSDISFSYDESLFNAAYSQLEITDSDEDGKFTLVINTTTKEVTEDKVQLSLSNQLPNSIGGFIANEVIQVPEYVKIGQPFTVKLLTESITYGEDTIDWIKGGLSTITAKSENDEADTTSIKVAVDTPVWKTETIVYNSNRDEIANSGAKEVLAGEEFFVETKFIPAKSKYMFADNEQNINEDARRVKHSFFQVAQSNAITPVYDGKYDIHFVADNQPQTDPIAIDSYTFKYADTELAFNLANADEKDLQFYLNAITSLSQETSALTKGKSEILISNAGIGSFNIYNSSSFSMVKGSTTRLYLNDNASHEDSQFLSAEVFSNTTPGRPLDNMLKNVGIRFVYNDGTGILKDAVGTYIEFEGDATNGGTVEMSNGDVYYLPYSTVAEARHGYWDITAIKQADDVDEHTVIMQIVLFTDLQNKTIFQTEDENEKIINITNQPSYEVAWKGVAGVSVILEYKDAELQEETINLSNLISKPADKEAVFYAYFGDDKDAAIKMATNVFGPTGFFSPIKAAPDLTELLLFPLRENVITLYNTGTFDVYFATIDSSTKQPEKWCTAPKEISCQKALYEDSVIGANVVFKEDADGEEISKIYTGSAYTFDVEFIIAEDSLPAFQDALAGGQTFEASLYNAEGENVTHYFSSPTYKIVTAEESEDKLNKYVLTYSLRNTTIDKQTGEKHQTELVVSASLAYYKTAGGEIVESWGLAADGKSTADFTFDTSVTIYTAIPDSISTNSTVESSKDAPIVVTQTLQQNGEYSLKLPNGFTDVEDLIEKMIGTVTITDQQESTESLEGKWQFSTSKPDAISINADLKSFTFKNAATDTAVEISIVASDDPSKIAKTYYFSLTSQGIACIQYKETQDGELKTSNDTTKAEVYIDGEKGKEIVLSELIDFYLDEEAKIQLNEETAKIEYDLSSATLSDLDPTRKTHLFGTSAASKGWLTLVSKDGEIYGQGTGEDFSIAATNVTSIKFNGDFAQDATLRFNITGPGINTTLILVIKEVKGISDPASYPYKDKDEDQIKPIYAAT
ncbi:MAG: hypothetical protein J6K97_02065, partial [Clostridia bacterium]|nr:hypothetical protein [Clostridia bacterium]